MGIKKLFGDIYYADFRDPYGVRRRESLQTTNLKVAQLKYAEIIHKRNLQSERVVVDMTWEDYKTRFFQSQMTEKAKNTLTRYKQAIEYMETVQKPRLLVDVTPELIQRTKEYLLTIKSGKHNVNRLIQCLKAMMHRAEKLQYVPKREWSVISKIKTPKGRVVYHSVEEIKKILAACPSDGWRLVVLLGCDAGLRRGEIAQLRWEDVDFELNQIYVAPNKTENNRYVPMTAELRNALEKAKNGAKTEFVVEVGRAHGKNRKNKDFISAYYRHIAKEAGVPSFMHKLRHTFASHLVRNGVDIYTVSKLLGHTTVQMTEIYAHLAPKTFQDAIVNIPSKIDTTDSVPKCEQKCNLAHVPEV